VQGGQWNTVIDISSLANGIYGLTLQNLNGVALSNQKFVKAALY